MLYNNRGRIYSSLGKHTIAIADYSSAIRIESNKVESYRLRASAYQYAGKYTLAIADYTRAISIKPEDANIINERGNVYFEMHHYTKAIADYTRAINIKPEHPDYYFNRAVTKENAGAPYCNDYRIACDLGDQTACNKYNHLLCR